MNRVLRNFSREEFKDRPFDIVLSDISREAYGMNDNAFENFCMSENDYHSVTIEGFWDYIKSKFKDFNFGLSNKKTIVERLTILDGFVKGVLSCVGKGNYNYEKVIKGVTDVIVDNSEVNTQGAFLNNLPLIIEYWHGFSTGPVVSIRSFLSFLLNLGNEVAGSSEALDPDIITEKISTHGYSFDPGFSGMPNSTFNRNDPNIRYAIDNDRSIFRFSVYNKNGMMNNSDMGGSKSELYGVYLVSNHETSVDPFIISCGIELKNGSQEEKTLSSWKEALKSRDDKFKITLNTLCKKFSGLFVQDLKTISTVSLDARDNIKAIETLKATNKENEKILNFIKDLARRSGWILIDIVNDMVQLDQEIPA